MEDLVCIVCPNGCVLQIEKVNGEVKVSGNMCKRGCDFALKEINNPSRTLCTTVRTIYKDAPRLSVRTDGEIPRNLIFDAMEEINKITLDRPVKRGEIIVKNIENTGINVISTSDTYYLLGEDNLEK